eukprot:1151957-Pelagomonas_calceolata.AAC.1
MHAALDQGPETFSFHSTQKQMIFPGQYALRSQIVVCKASNKFFCTWTASTPCSCYLLQFLALFSEQQVATICLCMFASRCQKQESQDPRHSGVLGFKVKIQGSFYWELLDI